MLQLQRAQSRSRFVAIGALLSLVCVTLLVFGARERGDVVRYVWKSPSNSNTKSQSGSSACLSSSSSSSSSSGWASWKNHSQSWEFVAERDGDNYGLSDEQCQIAFPKLFVEIEKSVAKRKDRPITFRELNSRKLENGMVRGVIYRGELYILNYEPMPVTFSRAKATLSSLHRALTAIPNRHELPSIEFIFTTEDFAVSGEDSQESPIWAYSKRDGDDAVWLMPDFGYWSWPEVYVGPYREIRRRIAAVDNNNNDNNGITNTNGEVIRGVDFQHKKKQLLWRGSVATEPELRGKLLNATRGKSWASVHALDWADPDDLRAHLLPMEEHCRYMFLAHAEGRSWSGRGKYLLNCRSVFVSHALVWREAHHAALVPLGSGSPDANYVEVARDFSDLEAKIEFLLDHPDVAERIADNAVRTFRDRYLTPAAEACYWRRLIRQYADVCDFEPSLYVESRRGERELRGVPFESWLLTEFRS